MTVHAPYHRNNEFHDETLEAADFFATRRSSNDYCGWGSRAASMRRNGVSSYHDVFPDSPSSLYNHHQSMIPHGYGDNDFAAFPSVGSGRNMAKSSGGQRMRTASTSSSSDGSWRAPKHPQLFKTTICDYYDRGLPCKYGAICWFAHGEHELRDSFENRQLIDQHRRTSPQHNIPWVSGRTSMRPAHVSPVPRGHVHAPSSPHGRFPAAEALSLMNAVPSSAQQQWMMLSAQTERNGANFKDAAAAQLRTAISAAIEGNAEQKKRMQSTDSISSAFDALSLSGSHVSNKSEGSEDEREICDLFAAGGSCVFGDNCNFAHRTRD